MDKPLSEMVEERRVKEYADKEGSGLASWQVAALIDVLEPILADMQGQLDDIKDVVAEWTGVAIR